uniref:NADH-ubiquinone oxidoreductase chain 6 n=1 Tax=Bolivaritettix yuanbaoshanensis TaxID=2035527 RepID=A0A343K038_9ORTH|nr:NADH dehydrogenase subunit 6 [Bolivaritettix yuanbaoshanensis]
MKTLMTLSMMMNIMFMNTKQPMNMIIIILIQTAITTFLMSIMMKSSWFNYILMIIFIGGMMVLFTYITSIAPNEKNYNKINIMSSTIIITLMMTLPYIWKPIKYNNTEMMNNCVNTMNNYQLDVNLMFNKPMFMMSITMMIYLFMTLIAVNKISNLMQGPLRKKN